MRNVVSSGNDALNLLFEAVAHTSSKSNDMSPERQPTVVSSHDMSKKHHQSLPQAIVTGTSPAAPPPVEVTRSDPSVLGVWNSFRLVRVGWFTAKEAVTFVDR